MCLYIIRAEMPTSENLKSGHSVSCILPTLNINNQPNPPPKPQNPASALQPQHPDNLRT